MTLTLDRPEADTSLDLSVLESLDFAPRCEGRGHGRGDNRHDAGPATHLLVAQCPHCDWKAVGLRCSKFANFWYASMSAIVMCNCGMETPAKEFIVKLENI